MELAEIQALGWCDLQLEAMAWESDGRDVVIRLLGFAGSDGVPARRALVCRWADGLVAKLAYPRGHGGRAMTWDAAFQQLPDGRFDVCLDFAGHGELRLLCSELDVIAGGRG